MTAFSRDLNKARSNSAVEQNAARSTERTEPTRATQEIHWGARQLFAFESRMGCRRIASGESANPWCDASKAAEPSKRVTGRSNPRRPSYRNISFNRPSRREAGPPPATRVSAAPPDSLHGFEDSPVALCLHPSRVARRGRIAVDLLERAKVRVVSNE